MISEVWCRRLDGFPGKFPSRRHLPGHAAGNAAVLPDQEHGVGFEEGQVAGAVPAFKDSPTRAPQPG